MINFDKLWLTHIVNSVRVIYLFSTFCFTRSPLQVVKLSVNISRKRYQTRWFTSEWSSVLTVTIWRETKVKSVQTWLLWHGYDPIHLYFCGISFSRTCFQIAFNGNGNYDILACQNYYNRHIVKIWHVFEIFLSVLLLLGLRYHVGPSLLF